ncbi:histidine kinase dimerization/phospho-acceptor domain-containing protein [Paenibacillus phytorum]|uniref:histidine kinase dimerization/phospho-acceptor domain-containing protein n=1 Tax=Paenibacillus phytorum TaxID=2654977 RepID=UPI0028A8BDB3|nr:histidine kinase dimerization/phospho-acceptor domain-containing protein [Paenibacillus phytorum]
MSKPESRFHWENQTVEKVFFAAGVAHEIRNPLTTLKGFLSLLKSRTTEKDSCRYLEIMSYEIEHMERVTNQFLTVAKPQTVKFEKKNLGFVIRQVASFLYPLATMNNVQILIETESGDPFIECEENYDFIGDRHTRNA